MSTVWQRFSVLPILCGFVFSVTLHTQTPPLTAPSITATAKGPNQINLTWKATANPGYGYLVEIQSDADGRYTAWRELRPIPDAGGFTCDSSIVIHNATCTMSDPSGKHVYNPPTNGIPYWVTEATYTDPQDDSSAQFIAWGLKANTAYKFRVRSYSGLTNPAHGAYSNIAPATTLAYPQRYVSPNGKDTNDGTAPDPAHAWRSLSHGARTIACGQELIVMGGKYANDGITMAQACSAAKKAVVMVNPGDEAMISSVPAGAEHAVTLQGSYLVVDGLKCNSQNSDYDFLVSGHHIALLNVETRPQVVPTLKGGVDILGGHNLVYRSYLHDAGSPDAKQNPAGGGGYVLVVQGTSAVDNLIWSNHLTRGGHDVSLCIRSCVHNRWLNNVMDGGWGMGFEAIQQSEHNLVEGNFVSDVGQLVTVYKPGIELSSANNSVRRNVFVRSKSAGLEVSALYGGDTVVNTRVYNNVFYAADLCYFQSHNGGLAAYDRHLFKNNICYKFTGHATDIYMPNKTGSVTHNAFYPVDAAGVPQPGKRIIIWGHESAGDFQYPQILTKADADYNPPFSQNKAVEAKFVDETKFDLHLAAGSTLIAAGVPVTDPDWGSTGAKVDIGAFGISPSPHPRAAPPKPAADPPAPAAPAAAAPPPAEKPVAATAPSAPSIPPGNVLRIGAAKLDRPTLTAIGIQLPIEGDLNLNAVVTVRFHESGSDAWREALPLFRVHPDVVTGFDVEPQFGGSIFDLKPGTKYEVELHAVDPDGNIDQRVTLTASTRKLPSDPAAPRNKPVRNATELAAALQSARPGDVIQVANGVYNGQFRIAAAGTAENPIVIRGASPEGTILDGQGCDDCNVLEVYGDGFVHIEGLTIRNANRAIRFLTDGAQANVVRRVHVRNTTLGITGHPNQKDFYIGDNTLEGRLKWPLFYQVDGGAHSDDNGIQVMGFGHVVCHNQISGYGDAMKISQRGARSVDFYGNDVRYSYDNGVELDEGAGNIRCFRNRFFNTYDALSVQPIYGGPAYLFRNVVVNAVDEQMKFHAQGNPAEEPSGVLVFHNTFVSSEYALKVDTPAMSHYFLIANNLFVGPRSAGLATSAYWDAPFQTGVFDYNAYFPDGIFHFNIWKAGTRQYPTLPALQGAGLETHGVTLSEPVFGNRFLMEPHSRNVVEPVDLALAPNSGAVDRGVYLPNINDGFTGSAPDLGALENGCTAPLYGPRPDGVDESNQPAGCSAPQTRPQAPSSQAAMLLLARASGGAPARTVIVTPKTPSDIAEQALQAATTGNLDAAFALFNASNFPQPKQDEFIREAYFELQVQRLLSLAAAHRCQEADRGITNLGYEDKNLPFSFFGFGAYAKRLRVQYLIGIVELACVDEKSARKRFEKISKATPDMASTDWAIPYLALAKLDPELARQKTSSALQAVNRGLVSAKPEQRGLLLYHQGMVHLAMGKAREAAPSFSDGARASTGMLRYLNLDGLRSVRNEPF